MTWKVIKKVLKWLLQTFTIGLIQYYEEKKSNKEINY